MDPSSRIRSASKLFALSLLVIFISGMGFSSLSEKSEEPSTGVDPLLYTSFMERLVSDIYDLEAFFTDQQNRYVPINPPFVDFILFQKSSPPTIPFDPKGFPKSFTDQLIPRMENSVPVYGVWIEEHPISRDILFYNQDRTLLHQLPRPAGDEPHAYLYALKPDLYSGHYSTPEIDRWLRIYDPARIQIFVQLLHVEEVEPYLYVEDILNRQTGEDGGHMMMMEGGSDDIAFIFINRPTASPLL